MQSEDESESSSLGEVDLALFSSYYGIQTTSSAEDALHKGDPLSLDGGAFNSQRYVVNDLTELKVEELLDKDAQLMHDIRNLDSDMQMLVYENYNKFIAATETIKRMKNNVEDMDADMSSIDNSMKSISGGSSKLDESLAPKRSKVEKLVRVYRLLERLQFLSSLPETLTTMMDNEQYEDAVQLYRTSSRVLKRYAHILSFQNIEKQCTVMMESLCSVLYAKLSDPFLEVDRRANLTAILSAIHSDREARNQKLVSIYSDRGKIILENLEKCDVALKEGMETAHKLYQLLLLNLADLFTLISPDSTVEELSLFESNASSTISRMQIFLKGTVKKSLETSDAALTRHGQKVLQEAPIDAAYLHSAFEEKCGGKVPTPAWHHTITDSFLDILNDYLDQSVDASFGALAALVTGSCHEASTLLHKVSVIRVEDDNGMEISEGMDVGADVASVRLVVPNNIRTSISSVATNLVPITEKVVESTLGLLEQLLQRATPVIDLMRQQGGSTNGKTATEYSSERFLAGLLERFFKGFLGLIAGLSLCEEAYVSPDIFHSIFTEFMVSDMAGMVEEEEVETGIASLLCSSALKALAVKVAPQVIASVEKRGFLGNSTGEHLIAQIQKIGEDLSQASTLLAMHFTESKASALSRKLLSSLTSPQSPSESYACSASVISMVCELDRATLALCCLLRSASPAAYSRSLAVAYLGNASRRQQTSKERIDIDKLFAAPVEIFPLLNSEKDVAPFTCGANEVFEQSYPVDDEEEADKGSRQSAGCVLIKLALKNTIEVIRTKIISSLQVDQMKRDVDFLRSVCEALVADTDGVMVLVDQLCATLEERATQ